MYVQLERDILEQRLELQREQLAHQKELFKQERELREEERRRLSDLLDHEQNLR